MIQAGHFLGAGNDAGIDFYTGVPCSFLTPLINGVITDKKLDYVAAASEGEAVAIASGAWLAGHRTAVMCQNSGLGNAVNPITSLNFPFRIPTLMVVTWRAGPGLTDEPQHELMGRITPGLLELMEVPHRPFPMDEADIAPAIGEACTEMDKTGLPFAFIMQKGDVGNDGGDDMSAPPPMGTGAVQDLIKNAPPPTRYQTLEELLAVVPDDAGIIATTGKCGRELFTIADRPQHLYQVGSMGCAAAMGLGVAMNSDKPVVVLDGDGAALMKMGTLGTIGAYRPENLIHIVLDNGTYDSTGGQPTVSGSVDFAAVAAACGYVESYRCDGLQGFAKAFKSALSGRGPCLIHMRIAPGSMDNLGRPTIKPPEVAHRFRDFLKP
ncbi:MAG: phosphonopyruvate decarboxylase [Rhodospirillales bacterium]|nr:phosphonopyruvate decarboxylase [Rhodospirillales bacterium]